MSLKDSIAYSRHAFHLYRERFDDEHLHLELTDVGFRATPKRVCVRIPLEIWAVIRSRAEVRLPWAGASDEEIMEAIWVAAEMRAGAAVAHSALALKAIAEARAQAPTSEHG